MDMVNTLYCTRTTELHHVMHTDSHIHTLILVDYFAYVLSKLMLCTRYCRGSMNEDLN